MNRKDSEKDSERPHYYSQFWLDVAAGRRIIGQPKPSDDAELSDTEAGESEIVEPAPQDNIRHIQRDSGYTAASDGRASAIIHPVAEPVAAPEEFLEPEAEEPDYATDEVEDLDLQEIDEADIPDMDLGPVAEEEETEEAEEKEETEDFLDEEEEEEEEDLDWTGRSRKKPKPTRVIKPPKKPRRDTRRSF
jgi:hypothetical protein